MMQSTPIILRIIMLFFVVIFFWAIVGMELFGGYVSDESPCDLLRLTPWCVAWLPEPLPAPPLSLVAVAAGVPYLVRARDTRPS